MLQVVKAYRAIAEYYDAENADQPVLEQDLPFFMGQLPQRKQSILELAVGTARAAIPLAQAGHRVAGVDYDEDMLAIGRRKRDMVGISESWNSPSAPVVPRSRSRRRDTRSSASTTPPTCSASPGESATRSV